MKLSLVVLSGKPEGKEIPIRLTQFLIGRDADCHLRPASPLISKRHCAILVREDRAYIRDFGSTNGTLVNQEQIQGEAELHDGDNLKVGPLTFQVKLLAEPAPTKAPDKQDASRDTVTDEIGSTLITESLPSAAADSTVPVTALKTARKSKAQTKDEDLIAEFLFDGSEPVSGEVPMGTTVMAVMAGDGSAGDEKKEEGAPEKARPTSGSKAKIPDNKATADAAKAILEKYMRRPRA